MRLFQQTTFLYIFWICLGFYVSGCSKITPEAQESCYFVRNSDKQRVSWKSNLPIKFKIHKDVPREAIPSILEAAKNWNTVTTKNIIEFEDFEAEGSPSASYADGKPMIFWKKDWEEDKSSEQGRSIIVWKGTKIKDADIWLNAKDFTFNYFDEELQPLKVDLVSLMVHEMGHTLGLEHNPSDESVMYSSLRRDYDRREIDYLEDLKSFGCEYGEQILNQENLLALRERQQERSNPAVAIASNDNDNNNDDDDDELEMASSSQGNTEASGSSIGSSAESLVNKEI